jgi:hypothetical protein
MKKLSRIKYRWHERADFQESIATLRADFQESIATLRFGVTPIDRV